MILDKLKPSLLVVFIITLAFLNPIGNITEDIENLTTNSLSIYQNNSCNISLLQFLTTNGLSENYIFKFDGYSELSCFGKIKYIEPVENAYLVFIGTHTLINLLLQSSFWIAIAMMIKKDNAIKLSPSVSIAFFSSLIFGYQFASEVGFNQLSNKNFSTEFSSNNYLLLSYILTVFLIGYASQFVLLKRLSSIILYFPFIFLISGTYQNLNVNFFVIALVNFGFFNLLKFTKNKFLLTVIYIFVVTNWLNIERIYYEYFDVDKLRGFLASSNSSLSIFLWSLVFYFLLNGLFFISKNTNINDNLLFENFLLAGFLVVVFGLIATTSSFYNLFIYFFFGQNKISMLKITSVEGNAWRGFLPSAESAGEFYGLILFLSFWFFIVKKQNFEIKHLIFLVAVFYGLIRSNNVSATIIFLILVVVISINYFIRDRKNRVFLYFFLTVMFLISSYFILRQNTYAVMGHAIVYEGWENSKLNLLLDQDLQTIQALLVGRDFRTLNNLYGEQSYISSSLVFITEKLTSKNNISFLPNPVTLLGVVGLMINRAEKWGLFFASFNPGINDALFGQGVFNLSNYYFDINLFNDGLILPHSSILSYIVFFGAIPVSLFLIYLIYSIFKNAHFNNYKFFILLYLLINYIKSDSLLYLSNFILFYYFVYFQEINVLKKETK